MSDSEAILRMIRSGGVYYNISGSKPDEVFADAVSQLVLPEGVDPALLLSGLCEREGLMTTSVGNGIALPHPRTQLVTSPQNECIYVCFLDKAVNFGAMDSKPVFVLFIILSADSKSHLNVLSLLSWLIQQESFRVILKEKPDTLELVKAITQYL